MADERELLERAAQVAVAKVVAEAARRGMPVTVGGKPVDPARLDAQANRAILALAAETAGKMADGGLARLIRAAEEKLGRNPGAPREDAGQQAGAERPEGSGGVSRGFGHRPGRSARLRGA